MAREAHGTREAQPHAWVVASIIVAAVGCRAPAGEPVEPETVVILDPAEGVADNRDGGIEGAATTTGSHPRPPEGGSPPSPVSTTRDRDLLEAARRAMKRGDEQAALKLYLTLVEDHPSSPHVPAAYLAFAEHRLAEGHLSEALPFYEQVVKHPTSELAPYARYKLAWVHSNLGHNAEALEALVRVLGHDGASEALRATARKDVPYFYAAVGDPRKARAAFRQWVDDPAAVERMIQELAQVYADQGKSQERATVLATP